MCIILKIAFGNIIRGSSTCGSACCGSRSQIDNVDISVATGCEYNDTNMASLYIQSGEEVETKMDSSEEKSEVVTINMPVSSAVNYAAIYDDVATDIYTQDFSLGEFLSRPTKLHHTTFTPGSPFVTVDYQIWEDFFSNTRIAKKLDNFAYIQCTLKLKIVVNSTPFVYGLIGYTYTPQTGLTFINSDSNNKICLSQRPTTWIDLSTSQGGEMVLPFFHYKNWLEIGSLSEVHDFGELKIWQLVQPTVANAGITSTPSVTVYGWIENVKLYGNTINLAVQSGEDNYPNGPVSSVASTIGNAADYFANIPIIGRFAKATSIGAKAVGAIATMFGFTNNPIITDATPIKSQPFHGLASAHISNVVDKLTLDPKNELSISPTTVGLPARDELAIADLTSRESIIASASWATASASGTLLFACNVCPTLCEATNGVANQWKLIDTPLGMTSRLFSNWRGDIKFRFKVVKTPYHKGSLVINYDPAGNIITTSDNNNVVQTVIVDISETDEFEIVVPYMAPQSFLRNNAVTQNDWAVNGGSIATYNDDYHNGRLTVRVLNNLTAPLDTASVSVVAWVSGCDNFELGNPSDLRLGTTNQYRPSPFQIQSGEEPKTSIKQFVMGVSTPTSPHIYDVNFGERIASVRELMRRAMYINMERANTNVSGTSLNKYVFTHTKYPPSYGFDSNGIHGAQQINGEEVDVNFNFTHPNVYSWMQTCFVGMRGSMIWHYCGLHDEQIPTMKVCRITETTVSTRANLRALTSDILATSYSGSAKVSIENGAGLSGQSLVHQATQAGLSVLYPQYTKFRFVSASPTYSTYGIAKDDTINEKFELTVVNPNNGRFSGYDRYCSIGPDFNFFFFVNVPPRYNYVIPAPSTF